MKWKAWEMAEVRFENVQKVYSRGDAPAVADFSLEVRDGEFLVLVGPSGCGKSTSLRMVAGLETPTSGRIFIGGRDVTDLPPKDRDIAMVFQNYALYPHMTVEENLSFGLKLRHVPKGEIARRVGRARDGPNDHERGGVRLRRHRQGPRTVFRDILGLQGAQDGEGD